MFFCARRLLRALKQVPSFMRMEEKNLVPAGPVQEPKMTVTAFVSRWMKAEHSKNSALVLTSVVVLLTWKVLGKTNATADKYLKLSYQALNYIIMRLLKWISSHKVLRNHQK